MKLTYIVQKLRIGCLVLAMLCCGSWAVASSYDDFFKAIKADDTKTIVNLLFRGFDPNTVDATGLSGLLIASREGSLKVAELLLSQHKTQLELRTPQDENALMFAALGGHISLAKMLIAKGADVNKTGWTPLHYAATKGDVGIIKLLREHHAYIDAESPNLTTPLMMAAMYGTSAAVKLLIEEGADVGLKNEQGMTAYDFAMRAQREDAAQLVLAAQRAKQPKGSW